MESPTDKTNPVNDLIDAYKAVTSAQAAAMGFANPFQAPSPKSTVRVVIVDQFSGFSPYAMQQDAARGNAWCVADFEPGCTAYNAYVERATLAHSAIPYLRPAVPVIERIPEDSARADYKADYCTTVFRENAAGVLEFWQANWDSSG